MLKIDSDVYMGRIYILRTREINLSWKYGNLNVLTTTTTTVCNTHTHTKINKTTLSLTRYLNDKLEQIKFTRSMRLIFVDKRQFYVAEVQLLGHPLFCYELISIFSRLRPCRNEQHECLYIVRTATLIIYSLTSDPSDLLFSRAIVNVQH